MVLPAPGGPSRKTWWPPAAATIIASTASVLPTTSARSRASGVELVEGRAQDRLDGLRLDVGSVRDRRLAQRRDRDDANARYERRLVGVARRHHDGVEPSALGGEHRGQDAVDRTQPSVQTELAEMHDAIDGAGVEGTRSGERGDRDGQIEPRTVLRQRGRREVDRDLAVRQGYSGVRRGRSHAVLGLVECAVGQPDEHEGGQVARDVGLDLDQGAVDAEQRHRVRTTQHG